MANEQSTVFPVYLSCSKCKQMLAAQNGVCAICGKEPTKGRGRKLHIDHDHETGKRRGLLCNGCNTGIGSLGDDVSRLQRAIKYLMLHGRT